MNELDMSCDRDRFKLFGYSPSSGNELEMSCELDGRELCRTSIKVHAQLTLPLKSLFTCGCKLEMRWK
jgi:hypothetical protein